MGGARRLKVFSILGILLLSALTFLAWSQSWGTLVLVASPTTDTVLDVPGSVAAPALSALGLAGIALAGALAIAGPLVRIVLGALEVLLGVSVLWSAIGALSDPVGAGASVVTTSTGVAGTTSIRELATVGSETPWPAVSVVLGALMVVAGLLVIVTVRRWPAAGRKYQAVTFESADGRQSSDPGDFFDEGEPDEASGSGAPDAASRPDAAARRDAAVDDWDRLTRGSDPTR
ncbi:Trp biosynthesis-associated membrane protein [Herbiconiux sp. KACC 21604]|uniref:Trp biosynthesis-associated membrane protein n=1 Tax=unclassified Herbiconiux TaxID=2618217 RepID=UPI001491D804|nr:Trp biosynthesis-associated membrane protein [Herbiconiux sp. SALV-R1]QJU53590.1 Trp biosynthesis-associated membrane protein [Herbiconiux sp. SALV-R1]WPO88570.1 Trp biosynthesis-associated membrane protein [Herbiconiux sp. KACC 21604]